MRGYVEESEAVAARKLRAAAKDYARAVLGDGKTSDEAWDLQQAALEYAEAAKESRPLARLKEDMRRVLAEANSALTKGGNKDGHWNAVRDFALHALRLGPYARKERG